MKGDWQTKLLGDVCDIALGKTPARAENAYWDEDRDTANVWLSIADLQNAYNKEVHDSREYLSDEGAAICKIVAKGTLLVSFKLTLGRLAFAGRDLYTNEAIAALTIRDQSELSKNYLYYYLMFYDWYRAAAHDLKLKGLTLNKAKLKMTEIRFPSLPEQSRIVQVLDRAFDLIAAAEATTVANVENARAIFAGQLQRTFAYNGDGWSKGPMGEHVRFIDYRGRTPKKTESGLRLITAKNVKMGYLQETPKEYVAAESYERWMTRGIPRAGDVLFTTEAPLANVAQLDTDEKVVFAQRIIIMQPEKTELRSGFLKYLLMSPTMQRRILSEGTGATATGIKARILKKIEIAFPSDLSDQDRVVQTLDALGELTDRLSGIYEKRLTALEELRRSILDQAFTGQLRKARG